MADSIVVIPLSEYRELLQAKELLNVTKKVIKENKIDMADTLALILEVELNED